MLDKFKKLLASVETQVEAKVESVETALEAEFSVMRVELAQAINDLAEMTSNFEASTAAVSALTAEKAASVVQAEVAKFAARKEKVVLAIGTEKASGLMLATQSLDDAAFDAVVSALAGSVAVEAATGLFTEVGVSAVADASKIVEESPAMKILTQKYNNAK